MPPHTACWGCRRAQVILTVKRPHMARDQLRHEPLAAQHGKQRVAESVL